MGSFGPRVIRRQASRLFDISADFPVEAGTEVSQPMALMAVGSKLIRQSREVNVVRRRLADVVTPS